MISTTATLGLYRAIFALDFRKLDANDRASFCEAQADAQIAFGGEKIAHAICAFNGAEVMIEEGNTIAVIVSGETAEVHYMDPDGDAYAIQISLAFGL
jgi:hypothetical protein